METAAQKSAASGGGDSGGHLCHLCGYKYASAHPSAKHRRAHKKNCGNGGGGGAKSPPAAAAASTEEAEAEPQGKKLLLDEREAEAGEGNAAAASDSGAGLPGSAQDAGNAVVDGDNGVHEASPSSTIVQVIVDDVTCEVAPKANGTEIQTEVAIPLSENALHVEDLQSSESHVTGDQSHDASAASQRQSEPEDGARFSPDISADEMSKSDGQSLASDAAVGEFVDGKSATTVEEDVSVSNLGVVTVEQIPGEETQSKEESGVIRTSSAEQALRNEEPSTDKHVPTADTSSATAVEEDISVSNLGVVTVQQIPSEETQSKEETGSVEQALGSKEPSTDKHFPTDDTSGVDLPELVSGGCHLEAADAVETPQQTDPTSVVAEQLTNSKQADLEEGQSYPNADEVVKAAWATEPADNTGDLTKKDLSEVTMEDGIQSDSSHPSTIFMASQADLVEPSSDPTSHDINMISKEDLDENIPNENISADLAFRDTPEAQSVDAVETTSHETKAVRSTENTEEIKQIEQITAEASPTESSVLHCTSSVEERELIEEVIADPASYKVDVISSRDIVVEKEESDENVGTAQEINVVDVPANAELEKHDEETTRDPAACETDIMNTTDNVEEKKQIEETTTDPAPHAISVIHSPSNDDKVQNENMSEVPSSNAVVDGTDDVEVKDEVPSSYNMDTVGAVDVVEVKKRGEEVTAELNCPEIDGVHTVDNVKEKESEEPAVSCKTDASSIADSILAVNPSSHENNTSQGTDDTEKVASDHAGDNIPVAQSTVDVAEKKHKDEATTAEIKTTDSTNGDHNEEITDKEMTIDSDKSHVSLKSLLSEKGMETTKEKKATSTKDRVLSFRRRSSKDNPSPGKPGSVEQDWNSPARLLPVEKSPKGKKQPWMPFICCHSMNN